MLNILMGNIHSVGETSRHPLRAVLWSHGKTPVSHKSGQAELQYVCSSDLKHVLCFYSTGGRTWKHGEAQVRFKHPAASDMLLVEWRVYRSCLDVYLFLVYKASTHQGWFWKSRRQFRFLLAFFNVCFWRINEGIFPVCDVGCSVALSFSLNWNSGQTPPVLVFWSKCCVSSGESARAKEHSIHLCTSSDGLKEKGLPVWGIFRLVQQGHVLVCNDRTRWL